jgi:hypothetical protein
MKKFLSLVLSLAMTVSLVTISAGATDYKNLSDKGEIQYEEAVAVLNKLGIITGYEDGSFKPTGALTRGAAAKIIVSMMIGADAASALTVAAAPYKDVPVTNTFAAVISYCKTKGYINGYTDGTFRPTAALSGYAFTKMLLGALGYDGVQEGFTGLGWTMNVASLGNTAGLFNDFDPVFSGNASVDRQSACLLALNTLKATEVTYSGGTNITTTTGNATTNVSTNKERSYKTSNNDKINTNISNKKTGDADTDYPTLEFGEEHFQDLRLETGSYSDDFGRPATKWSYKNVTIGKYAETPDYIFTKGPDGDTPADKVKDMGLKDFKFVDSDGKAYANTAEDVTFTVQVNGADLKFGGSAVKNNHLTAKNTNKLILEFIADKMTGNGVQVEVYLKDGTADTIQSVVVIYTQLMQVNNVKSSEVTLKTLDDPASDVYYEQGETAADKKQYDPLQDTQIYTTKTVSAVEDDDDCYAALKDLKADDYVLVTPVLDTGTTYKVASIAVPQTVTGSLTNVKVKSNNNTVNGITIAGTAYSMSKMWSAEDNELSASTKLTSTKDSTAYLDSFGNVIYATDVTASNSAIIIDEITSSLVDGKIVKYATGWDSNGNTLSLNLGTKSLDNSESWYQGKTFEYKTSTSNNAEYALVGQDVAGGLVHQTSATYVKNGDAYLRLDANDSAKTLDDPFDSDVKFIFITRDDDGDVTGITVHDGVTEVGKEGIDTSKQYVLSYVYNKDKNKVVSVIVPNDSDAANTASLLYFQKVTNHINNADGKRVAIFTAYIDGEKVTDCQLNKDVDGTDFNDKFYTYSKDDSTGVYTLSEYTKTDKTTSVASAQDLSVSAIKSKTYFDIANETDLNAKNAKVIDLYTDDGTDYSSLKEMNDSGVTGFTISLIYNGNDDVTGYRTVSYIFITANLDTVTTKYSVAATTGLQFSTDTGKDKSWSDTVRVAEGTTVYVEASATGSEIGKTLTLTDELASFNGGVLAKDDNGFYYFQMPAKNVTKDSFSSLSYKEVTDCYYDAENDQVYLTETTGDDLPSPETEFAAVKSTLAAAGATDIDATTTTVSWKKSGSSFTTNQAWSDITTNIVSYKVDGVSRLGSTANTTIASVTGTVSDVNNFVTNNADKDKFSATNGKIESGKDYGTVEYVERTLVYDSDTTDAFSVTYKVNGETAVTGPTTGEKIYLPVGKTFQVILTNKAEIDLNKTNAGTVTASVVDSTAAACSNTAVVDADNSSATVITFTKEAGDKLAEDDALTFTYAAPASKSATAAITLDYVAPAD